MREPASATRELLAFLAVALALARGAAASQEAEIQPLVMELAAEDAAVRAAAAERLLQRGPSVIPALLKVAAGDNLALAVPVRELLSRFGPDAIQVLIDERNLHARDAALTEAAAGAAAQMGPDILRRMVEMLVAGDKPGSSRGFACAVLRRMGAPAVDFSCRW